MGLITSAEPERTLIAGSLEVSRMINGLWQLAGGHDQDVDITDAANVMEDMISSGLDTFDMADHYGDAELVIGCHNKMSTTGKVAMTKWCPQETTDKSFERAEGAVDLALRRMNQEKIELLQYHAWDYTNDSYLHNLDHLRKLQKKGKIGLIGLTNTDAAHLELLLDSGFPIATNQVATSVIDRRLTRGRLNDVCVKHGVGILAYGTLLGGFLSEKWLGQTEPVHMNELNWSLRKYLRFIWAAGGWKPFQTVLEALHVVAQRHNVSISAVASRYVLDIPSVKAIIIGTRLSSSSKGYVSRNLEAFSFKLTEDDMVLIRKAQENLSNIPGDCGDEYRRPPFLTAAGNLSDHLEETDERKQMREAIEAGKRIEYTSGSIWEPIAGYCRAVRTGSVVRVSGTTSNSPISSLSVIGGANAASQTVHILDVIEGALKALGSSLSDVVRTRIMVRDASTCEAVSRAHGWVFANANAGGSVLPANTFTCTGLIGEEMLVEIEAEAEAGCSRQGVLRITKA